MIQSRVTTTAAVVITFLVGSYNFTCNKRLGVEI